MLVRLVDADVFVAMLSLSPGAAAVEYGLDMLPSSVFYNLQGHAYTSIFYMRWTCGSVCAFLDRWYAFLPAPDLVVVCIALGVSCNTVAIAGLLTHYYCTLIALRQV